MCLVTSLYLWRNVYLSPLPIFELAFVITFNLSPCSPLCSLYLTPAASGNLPEEVDHFFVIFHSADIYSIHRRRC